MKSKGRMKFKGSGVRPSSIPEDSPFAKYYEGGWIPIPSRKKHHCSEGYHWVKRYKTKKLVDNCKIDEKFKQRNR